MSVPTYTGLDVLAHEVDKSLSVVSYVVLQRPASRNHNQTVARVNLDADSLGAFMPARGALAAVAPPGSAFARRHSDLAEGLVAWLRHHMDAAMASESEDKFKVNLWGPKGHVLVHAQRIVARRVTPLTAKVHAMYGDPDHVPETAATEQDEQARGLAAVMLAVTTHGLASFNARVHHQRGEHEAAAKASAVAEEALQVALALGGYPDAAHVPGTPPAAVLPFPVSVAPADPTTPSAA